MQSYRLRAWIFIFQKVLQISYETKNVFLKKEEKGNYHLCICEFITFYNVTKVR